MVSQWGVKITISPSGFVASYVEPLQQRQVRLLHVAYPFPHLQATPLVKRVEGRRYTSDPRTRLKCMFPPHSSEPGGTVYICDYFMHQSEAHWQVGVLFLNAPEQRRLFSTPSVPCLLLWRVRRGNGFSRLAGVSDTRGERGLVAVAERGGGRVRLLHYAPALEPFYKTELTHVHR